jgi:colanic acid/amylovoran biosynthesis protein
MKVLITNTVVMNAGVAAMVNTIADLVRDQFGEDAECIVYEQTPEVAHRHYPHHNFRQLLYYRVSFEPEHRIPRRFIGPIIGGIMRARFKLAARLWAKGNRRLAAFITTREERFDLEQYATADLVVSSGGTYLVDNYDLKPRIFDYEIVKLFNKPLVFFTQSLGPLEKPENRKGLMPVFEYAKLMLLRDEASLEHLRKMPVHNPNVHLSADTVFMMCNGKMHERAALNGHSRSPRRKAAISVRHWPYFKSIDTETGMRQYRESVAALASHLVTKHGMDVCFISTCQGIEEYWFNDSDVGHDIAKLLEPDVRSHVTVDEAFRTPEQMVDELLAYDLVVATRFHMAILALVAGVPTVGISYEFKTHELFDSLNIQDWEIDLEAVNSKDLCAVADRCLAADQSRLQALAAAMDHERQRVQHAAKLLVDVVNAA